MVLNQDDTSQQWSTITLHRVVECLSSQILIRTSCRYGKFEQCLRAVEIGQITTVFKFLVSTRFGTIVVVVLRSEHVKHHNIQTNS